MEHIIERPAVRDSPASQYSSDTMSDTSEQARVVTDSQASAHAYAFKLYREQLKRQLEAGGLSDSTVDPNARNMDYLCPICLADCRFCVATSCTHVYCCTCLMQHWAFHSQMEAMACPVCRGRVGRLSVRFTEEEWAAGSEADVHLRSISAYNRRFSGEPKNVADYLISLRLVGGHFLSELFNIRGLVWLIYFRMLWLLCSFGLNVYVIQYDNPLPSGVVSAMEFTDTVWLGLVPLVYVSTLVRRYRDYDDH